MIHLAEKRPFRVYALDFWGFGDSAKEETPPFLIDSYVSMVEQFLETLGIARAPVIGHSMGGTVALRLAIAHPERVTKIAVVGAPITGDSLHPLLKVGSVGWIANTLYRVPPILRLVVWLVLAGDSEHIQHMIWRDVSRANAESFFHSIGDLWRTDLGPQLAQVQAPTLGVFGAHDNIVRPDQAACLAAHVRHAQIAVMSRSRHFPMLDEPERFREVLVGFLSDADS
jgi:2-hydroxymuconate-semialdehyde hydrolase